MSDTPSLPELPTVVMRGLRGHCPRCGKGKLFARYLHQVDHCAICHEQLGHIRADDAPAWLTIVIVGHILAIILLAVVPNSTWPDWLSIVVWISLALVLSFAILPRAKGMFIGILWRMEHARSGPPDSAAP